MGALPPSLERSLKVTASIVVTEMHNEGMSAANRPTDFPLAQISERLDRRACPLCRAVDGMILKVGTPEYAKWRQPSHINCRRRLIYISKDDTGAEADFEEPDAELIRKHGHFHVNPEKHAALRMPAEPAGRHVIVRRVKNLETGEIETRLDWAPWWEQVPQWKRDLVLKARGATDDVEVAAILDRLGISDLEDAGQLRQATLLGLKDRVEGWRTIQKAASAAKQEALGDLRGVLRRLGVPGPVDSRIRSLAGDAGVLWNDREERVLALKELLDAGLGADVVQRAAAVARVDDAVMEGLKALGMERGPVRSVDVEFLWEARGEKHPNCDLRIDLNFLHDALAIDAPDAVWKTWAHESIHARQAFAVDYLDEFERFNGYEDGLAEVLARQVAARAGLTRIEESYDYFVQAYGVLARAAGVGLDDLARRAWMHPPGKLREALPQVVDSLRVQAGAKPLTQAKRQIMRDTADELFAREHALRLTSVFTAVRNFARWKAIFE